jgi:hypothetical protein
MFAWVGLEVLGVAPANAQIEVARALGSIVSVVPESISTFKGVVPSVNATAFP